MKKAILVTVLMVFGLALFRVAPLYKHGQIIKEVQRIR